MEETNTFMQVGEFVRSSAGNKGFVVGKSSDGRFIVECINGMPRDDEQFLLTDSTGRNAGDDAWRFVGKWVEPKRIRGWMNVYRLDEAGDFQAGYVFAKRESADRQVGAATRLACIEIDVLEGAGLEGAGR